MTEMNRHLICIWNKTIRIKSSGVQLQLPDKTDCMAHKEHECLLSSDLLFRTGYCKILC